MESSLEAVSPVATPAPYLGGKRHLAARIVDRLASIPHDTYVEPFVGMGGVFLRRPFRARGEVINDLSRDVANLFRVLQRHYVPLMDMLRYQITSRAEFDRLRQAEPDTLTDLERAARFLYLQRLAYGGKVTGRSFGTQTASPARFDVTKLAATLADIHERLSGVVIECLSFERLIAVYDTPRTLFYLDPPYWDCETDYGSGFTRESFVLMAEQLAAIDGRFLLSLNDTPGVREIFRAFTIEAVETIYTVGGEGSAPANEVLISGPGDRCQPIGRLL